MLQIYVKSSFYVALKKNFALVIKAGLIVFAVFLAIFSSSHLS